MQFYRRSRTKTARLGVLAGSFNPPTIAHLALALSAQGHIDELLWVVPGIFPHKEYFGATLEQRLTMLASLDPHMPYSVASTEQGLFIDIARECKSEFGNRQQLVFLCGRDAAERILTWDYGREGVVVEMLREFELLVADRGGNFEPPAQWKARIRPLAIEAGHDEISSTEVRDRITRGEAWEHLVPAEIVALVREIYS
jgi:nicotinate (nicotinamide) nucleotide adenylyltransferase